MVNEFGNNSLQPKCSNINAENISEKTNFDEQNNDEDSLSSESDALIIDETIRRKITTTTNQNKKKQQPAVVRKKIFSSKLVEQKAAAAAENPFFNASLFELTETHENKRKKPPISRQKINNTLNTCSLQPNIQFKCPRCHLNGFETLSMLQQHFQTCCSQTTDGAATTTTTTNSSTKTSTGGVIYPSNSNAGTAASFKLTRKVFLCSACGTYYENWNLYVHMREFHRRFICLYCLGMFRQLDDLCEHIQGRHHQRAGHRTTPTDFYQVYREPCYVICCQCQRQFSSELDDAFFYHQCHHLETTTTTTTTTQKNRCQIEMTAVSSVISPPASPDEHVATVPEVVAPSVVQETDYNVEMDASSVAELAIDTRKVPKLSLKLPKFINKNDVEDEEEEEEEEEEFDEEEEEEEDEEKLKENDKKDEELVEKEEQEEVEEEQTVEFSVAGVEVAIKKLELDRPLDKIPIRELLQHCLNATIATCIFCNHARRIAVNGRQLAVHAISEHRFAAVNKSITEEELSPESFNGCLRAGLDDLSMAYFNLELSNEQQQQRPLFECFQCYFKTHAHKELYLHNRKFHSKSSLLCIMCKTNFYTYSELVSHLCAGNYDPGAQQSRSLDMRFRCALCAPIGDSTSLQLELPSAFRLMCHLRKRHATCDVCLENCHTQMALSNHVWKHKLHHFCYRCAIAYRNKPDITRHLFWKHGTESVTCQRCLQKKWSHVYHFCVPPALFECDICHVTQVHSAQALRVHKRLHTQEFKHQCQFDVDTCHEAFISRKLMLKHVQRCHVDEQHFDDKIEEIDEEEEEENLVVDKMVEEEASPEEKVEIKNDEVVEVPAVVAPPPVVKVDVLDLPELNLSEESSSDDSSCDEETKRTTSDTVKMAEIEQQQQEDEEEKRHLENEEILENPPQIVENLQLIEGATSSTSTVINMNDIWENFKNYQQEKSQKLQFPGVTTAPPPVMEKSTFFDIPIPEVEVVPMDMAITDLPPPDVTSWALTDHDYCKSDELPSTSVMDDKIVEMQPQLEESELLVQMSATTTDGAAAAEEQRYDHDYCSPRDGGQTAVKSDNIKVEEEAAEVSIAKKTSSSSNNSSNSSSSSSCECGSSCSCSDSSDDDDDTSETATAASQMSTSSQNGSSDSSTAEGRKRQLEARMRKRKMRGKALKLEKKQKKQQQQLDNSASSLLSKNETNNDNTAQKIGKKVTDEAAVTTTTTKVSNKSDRKQKCQIINESDLETSETETDEEFYDREPQKMALLLRQQQEEEDKLRVAQLLLLSSSSMTNNDIDISRPLTPPPEDGVTAELTSSRSRTSNRKKKNKKKKKKRRQHRTNIFDIDTNNCQPTLATAAAAMDDIIDVVNVTTTSTTNNPVILSQLPNVIVPPPPPSIPYYQQFHQQATSVNTQFDSCLSQDLLQTSDSNSSVINLTAVDTSSSSLVRSSKRRRVPNKFYGYSSGDELSKEQRQQRHTTTVKRQKMLTMATDSSRILSPKLVPPITIRHQTVEPITLRLPKKLTPAVNNDSLSVQPEIAAPSMTKVSSPKIRRRFQPPIPPLRLSTTTTTTLSSSVAATGGNVATTQQQQQRHRHVDSVVANTTENSLNNLDLDLDGDDDVKNHQSVDKKSSSSSSMTVNDDVDVERRIMTVTRTVQQTPQLYCYCRCPYDEVSEMIGCDSSECEIEWFHFECVGIMVPPKGQWYCPDCRKKNLLLNCIGGNSALEKE